MLWVNDSKATNPHAANASLASFNPVIWVAGGLSKGVTYDELVAEHKDRLKAVVMIGTDTAALVAALAEQAPDLPVYKISESSLLADASDGRAVMKLAVAKAHEISEQNDTVLMAPAAASMDQFTSYAERGNAFIDAVADLVNQINS